jgi:hypothetical protein
MAETTTKQGIKNSATTDVFNGQADIILFDEVDITNTTVLTDVIASGQSLGQIVEDSTSWDGDEPSLDNIKDEQGDVIVINPSSGTYAFSCDIASTENALIETFLKGSKVTLASGKTSDTITDIKDIVKFGTELPVITRPIAVVNDESNKIMLFPKAKIIGNLNLDSKLWRIHISATAEYVDTDNLGTCMKFIGKPKYGTYEATNESQAS